MSVFASYSLYIIYVQRQTTVIDNLYLYQYLSLIDFINRFKLAYRYMSSWNNNNILIYIALWYRTIRSRGACAPESPVFHVGNDFLYSTCGLYMSIYVYICLYMSIVSVVHWVCIWWPMIENIEITRCLVSWILRHQFCTTAHDHETDRGVTRRTCQCLTKYISIGRLKHNNSICAIVVIVFHLFILIYFFSWNYVGCGVPYFLSWNYVGCGVPYFLSWN